MNETATIVARVHEALRSLDLPDVVIALGGSLAKGNADALSDVDLYVFAASFPDPQRLRQRVAGHLPEAHGFSAWGTPSEGGVDFVLDEQPVEIWFRRTDEVLAGVARALSGAVERDERVWTPNGFYRHTALSDLSSMSALTCDSAAFAAMLAEIRAYPEALHQAVFAHGLEALDFWNGNLHLDTAIARQDRYYLESIYHQVRTGLVQCAFAANRKYFGGDKKMQEALEQLGALPAGFMRAILPEGTAADASSAHWRGLFDRAFAMADPLRQIYQQTDTDRRS